MLEKFDGAENNIENLDAVVKDSTVDIPEQSGGVKFRECQETPCLGRRRTQK